MQWRDRIILDPNVLVGKPIIRGTRLSVDFIVELLSEGWSEQQLLANYPGISTEDIRACLQYACEALRAEKIYRLGA